MALYIPVLQIQIYCSNVKLIHMLLRWLLSDTDSEDNDDYLYGPLVLFTNLFLPSLLFLIT